MKNTLKKNPQKIEGRILSFEDACSYNGVEPNKVLPYSDPQTGDEKSINAYAKLVQIIRAFNEGKVPDWKDTDQYKYYPWIRMSPETDFGFVYVNYVGWSSDTHVGSRLCLLNEDHVEIVTKRFVDIYREYMTQR